MRCRSWARACVRHSLTRVYTAAQLRASLSLQRPVANTDAMLFVDLKWPTLLPAVFTAFGPLTETTAARK